jgi:hypothetical protein
MSAVAFASAQPTFSERLLDLRDRADYRRADTDDVREAIYRLRYDAYVDEGAIKPSFEKRFTDPLDELGNAWIFGVYLDDKLVSSIRLHVATKDFPDMPTLSVFPDYLQPELDAGKIIIDPTRHVVEREAMRRDPNLVYLTMRLGWMAGEYFQADAILAAVRKEHQAFYRRTFGHKLMCEARPYPLLEKPISLMELDYFAERDRVNHRQPFFRSSAFERRMLFERLQEGVVAPSVHAPLEEPAEAEAV